MKLEDDQMCFVCGKKNELGLKLDFMTQYNKTRAVFIPQKHHQGYKDIVHGGILSAVLDEAMTRLGYELGLNTVTARIEVNFRKPAYVDAKLILEGEIIKEHGKKVFAKSTLTKEDGTLIADATGILVKIK